MIGQFTALALPTIASGITTCNGFSFGPGLTRLERMITDPLCSTSLLASLISNDPMLTARILGRANIGLPRDHEAIIHLSAAITRLGLATVHGLIQQTPHIPADQRHPQAVCWSLANATATMTRVIADLARKETRERFEPETLQIAGLLHDIGTMLTIDRFRTHYSTAQTMVVEQDLDRRRAMKRSLGLHAGGVGMLAARAWGLPAPYTAVIRYYETPSKAEGDELVLASLVHIARGLVQACGFLAPGQEYVEEIDGYLLDLVGLRVADLEVAIKVFFRDMEDHELYEGALV